MDPTHQINEIQVNLVSEGTQIEGKVTFDHITRVHGTIRGQINAVLGSKIVIGETGVVEGNIFADQLTVDGYVRGDISATKQIVISGTGRIVGNLKTPSLLIEFGAYFEGQCNMEEKSLLRSVISNPQPIIA